VLKDWSLAPVLKHWRAGVLAHRPAGRLVVAGWLAGWLAGCGWLAGWLAGWLSGWLAGWLDG
jgi:hypothetical protein